MPPHSTSCAQPLLHRYALHSAGARTLHSRQSTLFYQQRRHSTAAGVKENDPKIVIYARILCIAIRSVSAKIWARTDSLLRFFNRRRICFQARFLIHCVWGTQRQQDVILKPIKRGNQPQPTKLWCVLAMSHLNQSTVNMKGRELDEQSEIHNADNKIPVNGVIPFNKETKNK